MSNIHNTSVGFFLTILVLFASSVGAREPLDLDDAKIFAIFDQANTTDISTARLGLKYGSSVEVRVLAKMVVTCVRLVVTDHEAVQQMGRDLAKKLGVAPIPPDNDTSIDNIGGRLYKALFESEPMIRNMTVQTFSTLVFRLMAELEEIHSCKLEQRLANFLLVHASTDRVVRMTQQEIASHLGTTREVVARVLRQLSEKLIETKKSLVMIADPLTLASLNKKIGNS